MAVEAQIPPFPPFSTEGLGPLPPFSTEGLGPFELSCSHSTFLGYDSWIFWSTYVGSGLAAAVDDDPIMNKIKCFLPLPKATPSPFLVQFWGLVKIGDKLYLTTRDQPFAFHYYFYYDGPKVNKLCEYREHCLKCLIRTVDDDEISVEGVEQLIGGPLSRVFCSGLPEYAPHVRDYASRDYPLRDYAVSRVGDCWVLPVYHHPTQPLPSGVLEFVSSSPSGLSFYLKETAAKLQEVNLTTPCSSIAQLSSCQASEIDNIDEVLTKARRRHKLPYAQTWTTSGEILKSRGAYDFIRKERGVVGKAFSSKSVCFCRDIRQLSSAEYPLVPKAQHNGYSASFAVCLQSSCSNSCIYVLEFCLPTNEKDFGYPKTLLHMLMETLKEHLQSSFKIASGQELGEKLSVELIKVSPEDEFDFFEICNTTGIESTPRLGEVQGREGMMQHDFSSQQVDAAKGSMNGIHEQQHGSVGSTPRLTTAQGGEGMTQVDFSSQQVDMANAYTSGVHGQQSGIVGSPPRPEHALNIESIAHDEPTMEIDVEDLERDDASIEQSNNEETKLRVQTPSCTLRSELGISRELFEQISRMTQANAAKCLDVSLSTLKRRCEASGLPGWPPGKVRKVKKASAKQKVGQPATGNIDEHHGSDATRLEDDSSMWVIKAKYQKDKIKFELPSSARKIDLEENIAQRFDLSSGSFKIKYRDKLDGWILITCDTDLSFCMKTLRKQGSTTIEVLVS